MRTITTNADTALELLIRRLFTLRIGGENFDAPSGGYTFSAALEEERELRKNNIANDPTSALLCLSVADPTMKMHPDAFKALVRYYEESPDATRYTDNYGIGVPTSMLIPMSDEESAEVIMSTSEAIAEILGSKYNINLGGGRVQYSPHGIKGLLADCIPAAFFDRDATLFFPTPGYGVIKDPINCFDAEIQDVPLFFDHKWNMDFEDMGRHNRITKKFAYINVPHNPTGFGYTLADWADVINWATRHRVILIVDEAYNDIRYNGETCSILQVDGWEECAIVLQSVSKGWSATGLRFGCAIAHPLIIKAIRKVLDVKDSGLFGPSIAAGLECLLHPDWAVKTRLTYKILHKKLAATLRSVGFEDAAVPDAGLCQFTRAPRSINGIKFESAAECAAYLRNELGISVMHYEVGGVPYLRWAVTIKPVPECGLSSMTNVIEEMGRRLLEANLEF